MSVKALIFDFDGLLFDTETPIYETWREVYQEHGLDLPIEVYAACVGSTFSQFDPMKHLEDQIGKSLAWDPINEKREERIVEILESLEPLPGVRSLFEAATEAGLSMAVASSSTRNWVDGWLKKLDLRSHIHLLRNRDDVEKVKPAPDLFRAAREGLGVERHEAIVFEDSNNGLLAAQADGTPCIIVPNQITRHYPFEGAAAVLPSLDLPLPKIISHVAP